MKATLSPSDLSDEQLLAAFLPHFAVRELIEEYGAIPKMLVNCFPDELAKIHGVGPIKARQLQYVGELAKRIYQGASGLPLALSTPRDVFQHLALLQHRPVEEFWTLFLNTKNRVIAEKMISRGTINMALVNPVMVFHRAIKLMAAAVILVHNHPSGEPDPSQEDIKVTKKIVDAGKILDVAVLDHVIIGQGQYFSMKEKGVIK